ncbi:Nuclear transport factor 2 family protein [Paracoccus nototheniae]
MICAKPLSGMGPRALCRAFTLALVLTGTGAQAQDAPAPPSETAPLIEPSYATALIRDVLAAVNHGNWTGNYTVLRDHAAPDFAAANDPTRLAGLFTTLRTERLDLLQAMVVDPVILQSDLSETGQELRLTGYVPLQPRHVSFDLIFAREGRRWLLLGISVGAFDPIDPPPEP